MVTGTIELEPRGSVGLTVDKSAIVHRLQFKNAIQFCDRSLAILFAIEYDVHVNKEGCTEYDQDMLEISQDSTDDAIQSV